MLVAKCSVDALDFAPLNDAKCGSVIGCVLEGMLRWFRSRCQKRCLGGVLISSVVLWCFENPFLSSTSGARLD